MVQRYIKAGHIVALFLILAIVTTSVPCSAAIATEFTLTPLKVCTGSKVTFKLSFLWTGIRRPAIISFYSTFLNITTGELRKTINIVPGRNNLTFTVEIPWNTVPGKYVIRIRLEVYSNSLEEKPFYAITKYFIVYIVKPPPPKIRLLSPVVTPYTREVKIQVSNTGPCEATYIFTRLTAGSKAIYTGSTSISVPPGTSKAVSIRLNTTPPLNTDLFEITVREYTEPSSHYYAEYVIRIPVNFTGSGIDIINKSIIVPAEQLHLPLVIKNTFTSTLRIRAAKAYLDRETILHLKGSDALIQREKIGIVVVYLNLSGIKPGNYTLTLVLEVSPVEEVNTGTAYIPVTLPAKILPPPRLDVSPKILAVKLGESYNAEIMISNPTVFRLTIASISLASSDKVRIIREPHYTLGTIEPGGRLKLIIPIEGIEEGTGVLNVTILYGDPYRALHRQSAGIRVVVSKDLLGFLGNPMLFLLAVLIAIATTVLVVREFKSLFEES